MERTRLFIVGILALLLAGLTGVGIYRILRRAQLSQVEQTNVVVAAKELSVGVPLDPNMLKTVRINKTALPQGAFTNVELVKNRGLLVPVAKNEILTEIKLAPKEAGAGLPSMIPEGMRAVSVRVNEVVSVAGFVQPGTHVDVILTGDPDSHHESQDVTTTTVLQNVKVLAAGSQLQQNNKGEAQNVPVITLLVTPEEAQKLTLAATEGKIQLSLRNPLDQDEAQPPALRNALLYPQTKRVVPRIAQPKSVQTARAEVPTTTVEVIRGGKREQAKF
jgi:pilus assembly protein CpaB